MYWLAGAVSPPWRTEVLLCLGSHHTELGILPPYKQIFSFPNFLNNKLELVPYGLGMYIRQKVAAHALAFRFRSIISTIIEKA
jgi:hypothetical protein